jgi:hypothetical protein
MVNKLSSIISMVALSTCSVHLVFLMRMLSLSCSSIQGIIPDVGQR